ncbi:hypothetical protein NECHADRAFT_75443 [Paecilomyces variotii No. 5]|uniref:Uncharacterized protein n=1 Tax=Byssochlamys spectabilis (strain No. 5 / NBRC 109023) TaxID=1356009 RepID=V5FMC2_BYSSN|nr:hypothetical protein NECHADRAFT_75443 [Paecilomyces variotii No. 5]
MNDNSSKWEEYHFTEPKEGPQVAGELYHPYSGSTGTMLGGIWRLGNGIAGTNMDGEGTLVTLYTGVLGDETVFLLEGEVEVAETECSEAFLPRWRHNWTLLWNSWMTKGPLTQKLWVSREM